MQKLQKMQKNKLQTLESLNEHVQFPEKTLELANRLTQQIKQNNL